MKKINDRPFFHKLFGTTPGGGMQPKEAWAYSWTGFGQNILCCIVNSYLMVFMTDALGFNNDITIMGTSGVMAVAWLMLFSRIFDAINDPIMGSIVDRTRTKKGKCRPYILWMAIPIGVFTILCFLPWYPRNEGGFIALALVYVVYTVIYTMSDVPFWGLSTAMTNETTSRGKMLTICRLLCAAGGGIVGFAIPVIASRLTAQYTATVETQAMVDGVMQMVSVNQYLPGYSEKLAMLYFICAIAIVLIGTPFFFYGYKNTKEHIPQTAKAPSLKHNIRLLFKNKPLMMIVLSGMLGAAKSVYLGAGLLYFAKYAFANEGIYSIATVLIVPGGLAASMLVPWFTTKFGKKNTYIFSHMVGAAVLLAMYFAGFRGVGALVFCAAGFIILGIPLGISNITVYAMIGDTVDWLEWKTGERAEGICFAMQTIINKAGIAIGSFIGLLAYSMSGISSENPWGTITPEGLDKLWAIMILSAAASMFLTCIPMFFYQLNEKKQAQLIKETLHKYQEEK